MTMPFESHQEVDMQALPMNMTIQRALSDTDVSLQSTPFSLFTNVLASCTMFVQYRCAKPPSGYTYCTRRHQCTALKTAILHVRCQLTLQGAALRLLESRPRNLCNPPLSTSLGDAELTCSDALFLLDFFSRVAETVAHP